MWSLGRVKRLLLGYTDYVATLCLRRAFKCSPVNEFRRLSLGREEISPCWAGRVSPDTARSNNGFSWGGGLLQSAASRKRISVWYMVPLLPLVRILGYQGASAGRVNASWRACSTGFAWVFCGGISVPTVMEECCLDKFAGRRDPRVALGSARCRGRVSQDCEECVRSNGCLWVRVASISLSEKRDSSAAFGGVGGCWGTKCYVLKDFLAFSVGTG